MKPRVVVLHDWPPPDTVTPAVVVRSNSQLVVMYGTSDEKMTLVTFPHPSAVKVGGPNDESLSGHPLAKYGLRNYSVHKIENSPWLAELERVNAVHPSHDRTRFLSGKVHYLFALKEETVECIVVEQGGAAPRIELLGSRAAAVQRLRESIDISSEAQDREPDLPVAMDRDEPVEEELFHDGQRIRLMRTHCVDKMGPDADGYYEFYYDYEELAFTLGNETLLARTYANEADASLRGIADGANIRAIGPDDLIGTLVTAALDYFRSIGRDQVICLNLADSNAGYTLIRQTAKRTGDSDDYDAS